MVLNNFAQLLILALIIMILNQNPLSKNAQKALKTRVSRLF